MKGDGVLFAIGEAESKVENAKVLMPREYHLRHKVLFGVWTSEKKLYISDEKPPLLAKRSEKDIFEPVVDANHRLLVPEQLENCKVKISGCISTIEICFC
ncbi:MAG: hypothetical protein II073_01895 [Lachnospiraceae bacterium]|nr:hypothetical protein [Lachnospiraceae bacterium]